MSRQARPGANRECGARRARCGERRSAAGLSELHPASVPHSAAAWHALRVVSVAAAVGLALPSSSGRSGRSTSSGGRHPAASRSSSLSRPGSGATSARSRPATRFRDCRVYAGPRAPGVLPRVRLPRRHRLLLRARAGAQSPVRDDGPALAVLLLGALGPPSSAASLFRGKSGWCTTSARCSRSSASTGRRRSHRAQRALQALRRLHQALLRLQPARRLPRRPARRRPPLRGSRSFSPPYSPGSSRLLPCRPARRLTGRACPRVRRVHGSSLARSATLDRFAKVRAKTLTAALRGGGVQRLLLVRRRPFVEAPSSSQANAAPLWSGASAASSSRCRRLARAHARRRAALPRVQCAAAAPAARLGAGGEVALERRASGTSPRWRSSRRASGSPSRPGGRCSRSESAAPIEAGCRMGVCGADPVAVLDGMENLSPVGDDERATLERLGLADNTRWPAARAWSARSRSRSRRSGARRARRPRRRPADPAVRRVVVIGNGSPA